ncbi:MAG: GNAT family N-acetyltransferase [Betaproteobacteria bacterium]
MRAPSIVAETERLRLRRFDADDAAFFFELVNDPSWIRFIGKRDVKSLDAARLYLENGPIRMVERLGFGLNLVERNDTGEALGMCGLIKRDTLADVDIGFAFLPRHWGRGYALEAARATVEHGRSVLGIGRIVAILTHDNARSANLLGKLSFRSEGTVKMPPDGEELLLYASDARGDDDPVAR